MAEYFITKRERCKCYYGLRREFLPSDFDESSPKTLVPINLSLSQTVSDAQCKVFGCFNGYIESSVDLLTALNEARINDIVCDCGDTHWGTVEGDEGQMLEWICPKTGEKQRAVNA